MLSQALIESLFNVAREHSIVAHALLSIFVLLKVAIDCRKLSEGIAIHILPVILFPLLYLLLWLLIWPGTLVLAMKGIKLEDTASARMARRNLRQGRRRETGSPGSTAPDASGRVVSESAPGLPPPPKSLEL